MPCVLTLVLICNSLDSSLYLIQMELFSFYDAYLYLPIKVIHAYRQVRKYELLLTLVDFLLVFFSSKSEIILVNLVT